MINYIHWILIPHTAIILAVLYLMGLLSKVEEIIYIALFVVIYFTSYLYFLAIGFIIKPRPKLTVKARRLLVIKLYKIYGAIGSVSIVITLFSLMEKWNQNTITYLSISVILLLLLVYLSVKLSLWIIDKNRI